RTMHPARSLPATGYFASPAYPLRGRERGVYPHGRRPWVRRGCGLSGGAAPVAMLGVRPPRSRHPSGDRGFSGRGGARGGGGRRAPRGPAGGGEGRGLEFIPGGKAAPGRWGQPIAPPLVGEEDGAAGGRGRGFSFAGGAREA